MRIEIEFEIVTMKMTAAEAQAIHHLVCQAINDARREFNLEPEGEEVSMRAALTAINERLREIFYKHQNN